MERTTADSVWYTQTEIYHRPYPRIPGYWQTILSWNKCFRLRNRCSLIYSKGGQMASCCYSSHSMSPEEHNYPIDDKEMLSVIRSLEEWRHYLEGANLQFEIWNDHANLQWFMKRQDLNCRQARWAQYLSQFNFKWVHKAGVLSHQEDHAVGIQEDHKMVLIIPPEQITSTTLQIATDADDIRNHIRDTMVQIWESDVIMLCKKHGIREDQDGILFTRSGRMYVPEDRDLWMEIVCLHHDTPIPGHPGTEKTLELMQYSYTWPRMPALVKDYMSRCDHCTWFKGSNQAPPGKLKPLDTPPGPWKEISTDFITDLSESKGFDSILVVVDQFSKEVEFIPCTKSVSALDTVKLYLRHVWKHHDLPTGIVSDRGLQFTSQVMKDICKRLGIQPRLSTAYHPQTDGQTERINQDLQQYLHIFTSEKQDEWVSWLPLVQFSYNTKKQLSTEKSPFEVTRSY